MVNIPGINSYVQPVGWDPIYYQGLTTLYQWWFSHQLGPLKQQGLSLKGDYLRSDGSRYQIEWNLNKWQLRTHYEW